MLKSNPDNICATHRHLSEVVMTLRAFFILILATVQAHVLPEVLDHHIEFAEPIPFNVFFEKCNNVSDLLHEYCDPAFNLETRNIHIACGNLDLESTNRRRQAPRMRFAEPHDPTEFFRQCDVIEDEDFCRNYNSSEGRYIYIGC